MNIFAQEDLQHKHRLIGFYVKNNYYALQMRINRAKNGNGGKIYVNTKLPHLQRVKNFIMLDLKINRDYSQSLDYYVTLTQVKREQIGGMFPMPILPYSCSSVPHFNLVVAPMYSEPAISYVESLIPDLGGYEGLIENHNTIGTDYFNNKMALITEENYSDGSWRAVLLTDHLINNKYAHNGITEQALIYGQTLRMLETIHSLLHIYDALYMFEAESSEFTNHIEMLDAFSSMFTSEDDRYCLYRALNTNCGDFLKKSADGRYSIPYQIQPEAIPDKDRQYGWLCDNNPTILQPEFHLQLCAGIESEATGSTVRMPNT